ncbi:cyclin-dependent kinase inhibitor 1 isoform X1 [Gasterosteus aculeatus]|uniref:Cyclin dependent kinase inhibitor 1A n=1 Tax=Gasterosteus aculeatus aculeatus TaxID=481459 RepID=G3N7S4_GASAC|nr:cyclin-dependent kinase inhibitor 1 isoform X1 [Gasterosteus aculeatus aculeatus]
MTSAAPDQPHPTGLNQADLSWTTFNSLNCRTMAGDEVTMSTRRNGTARRNLFGPLDREQLQVEHRAALRSDLEAACHRWGFDFLSDKPLENSDFQWEGVPATNVPLLYRSCMHGGQGVAGQGAGGQGAAVKPQDKKENAPCSPEGCSPSQQNLEETPRRRDNTGLKRKQTNITDFYHAKRRVVGLPRKSGE